MTTATEVKKCEYSHQWQQLTVNEAIPHGGASINCAKCGAFPRAKEIAQAEAIVFLRERIKAGQTIYTGLDHVSRSGMMRVISVYLIEDNQPWDISGYVAKAIDSPRDEKRGGVRVGGCGMDMGFHIVYSLARVLFREFRCDGTDKCPSNDHNNERGEVRKAGYKVGRLHSDGGYALRHRWL